MSDLSTGDPVAEKLKSYLDKGFIQALGIVTHPISLECAVQFSLTLPPELTVQLLAQCLKSLVAANGSKLAIYINDRPFQFPDVAPLKLY
jgi:hypothetical protein